MTYRITFEPINPIASVQPTSMNFDSASETLKVCEQLSLSDEQVIIVSSGGLIDMRLLRTLAAQERAGPVRVEP